MCFYQTGSAQYCMAKLLHAAVLDIWLMRDSQIVLFTSIPMYFIIYIVPHVCHSINKNCLKM